MKIMNIHLSNSFLFLAIIICSSLLSCEKDNETGLASGPAKINVSLVGIESNSEDLNLEKSSSSSLINTELNPLEIPINKDLSAYVVLEEYKTSAPINSSLKKEKIAAPNTLTPGVRYGVLVYDGDNLVSGGQKEFIAGNESIESSFELDGGKTYTFIAYSRNSTTLPSVTDMSKLSTAKINDESGDLLYVKKQQTVQTGNNNLSIILKHQFTLVTTEIKVGSTYAGVINSIQSGTFAKSRDKASLKLSDGTITYSSTEKNNNITFPTFNSTTGVSSITSNSNLLIAENSPNTVTYSFQNITVNGIVGAIPATAMDLQAGKKYKLIITLDVPCVRNNTPTTFNISNGSSVNLNNITGNYGMTFDIDQIDDSFNIKINNTNLFEASYRQASRSGTQTRTRTRTRTRTQSQVSLVNYDYVSDFPSDFWESPSNTSWTNYSDYSDYTKWSALNFGTYSTTPYEAADLAFIYNGQAAYINAKFTNQSSWGWTWNTSNNTDYIYQINNGVTNPAIPTLRVIVSSNNQVSLFARKSNSDTNLYPIYLQTNPTLSSNTITDELTTFPNNYYLKSSTVSSISTATNSESTYSNYTKDPILNLSGLTIGYTYKRTQTMVETVTESRTVNQTIADQITFRQNAINWNSTGTNNIVLGQKVVGNTNARGKIYTRTKVNCATQNPV